MRTKPEILLCLLWRYAASIRNLIRAFDIPATYLTGGIFRLFFEIFKLNEA